MKKQIIITLIATSYAAALLSSAKYNPGKIFMNNTQLMLAAVNKDCNYARQRVDAGEDINARNSDGRTPLMYAVYQRFDGAADGYTGYAHANSDWYGSVDMVKCILDLGANIDAQDKNGKTALMHAVTSWQPDIVELLLMYGANPYIEYGSDEDIKNGKGKKFSDFGPQSRWSKAERAALADKKRVDKMNLLFAPYKKKASAEGERKESTATGCPASIG